MSEVNDMNTCIECGAEIWRGSTRCKKCASKLSANKRKNRVTLICEYCGGEYEVKASRAPKSRFCSKECLHRWRSENLRGENSPIWSRVTLVCEQCEEEFLASKYRAESGRTRFCSKECLGKWISENMSGKNSPNYKSEKVDCPICGMEFSRAPWEVKDGRGLFCSEECYGVWRSENVRGENHPGWQGDDEERECAVCGEPFTVRPHSNQKTCGSKECMDTLRIPKISGENHYNWQGGPEMRECEWCGDEFEISPGIPQRFCSSKCYGGWISKYRSGENSPSFNPDKEDRIYPPEFSPRLKRKIRKRDGYRCAVCRLYGHEVHHIDYCKDNCDENNLITLCKHCHPTTNANRDYWQPTFTVLLTSRLTIPVPHPRVFPRGEPCPTNQSTLYS